MVAPYWFQEKKYIHVGDLISPQLSDKIVKDYIQKADGNLDQQCPKSQAWYGQPELDWLMVNTLPDIELLTGLQLWPTYTYLRVYKPGEILHPHKDREACEISVTLNLGQSSNFVWPIWIQNPKDITDRISVNIQPQEAMIYHGCDCLHWRDEFNPPSIEDYQVQIFMHYVNKFGPNSSEKFDKRQNLILKPIGL